MKSLKKNQSGFSAVEVILVVIIVGLVGFIGWYVWHNRAMKVAPSTLSSATASTTPKTTTTSPTPNPYAGWKTYISLKEGLSFKYPASWTASNDPCVNPGNQSKGECYQISSPKTDASPYIFDITYYWNQQKAS